jgi:sec-independent protein translocase protein TatB
MFDIAWSELFVILIVALVVVGPKDLPKLMRTAGQWAGRARAMADQFRRSFDDMARQSELDELRAQVNQLQAETKDAAAKSMSDLDYPAFAGIPAKPLSETHIEEVGAAPPVRAAEPEHVVEAEVDSAVIARDPAPAPAPVATQPAVAEPTPAVQPS